jgi:hypothetical protein
MMGVANQVGNLASAADGHACYKALHGIVDADLAPGAVKIAHYLAPRRTNKPAVTTVEPNPVGFRI